MDAEVVGEGDFAGVGDAGFGGVCVAVAADGGGTRVGVVATVVVGAAFFDVGVTGTEDGVGESGIGVGGGGMRI